MTLVDVLAIVGFLLLTAAALVILYQRAHGDIYEMVAALIAAAEKTGLAGSQKMALVVDALCAKIPGVFSGILTRQVVGKIAQGIYDSIKAFYLERSKRTEVQQHPPDEGSCGGCVDDYCLIHFETDPLEPEDYDAPGSSARETGV